MFFDIYNIQSSVLKPYVQYILFNISKDPTNNSIITSFANTNICLGIINHKNIIQLPNGIHSVTSSSTITSYISGMYLKPHVFKSQGTLDEICIDFTPSGYYQFFPFPLKKYLINEDILTEAFGKDSKSFFELVFSKRNNYERGKL